MYKGMLQEYRRLQSELSPWMQAFEAKNGRQPGLLDVKATEIAWLATTYKQYLLMRDKLFKDIPFLKAAIAKAPKTALEALLPNKKRDPVVDLEPKIQSDNNVAATTHALIPSSSMCQCLMLSR